MPNNNSERDYAYAGAGTTDSEWGDEEETAEPDLDGIISRIERLEEKAFNDDE